MTKHLASLIAIGIFLGLAQNVFAGDALDSMLKCENVKGGKKPKTKDKADAKGGPDGSTYTVYLRSENNTRDGKVDIINTTAGQDGGILSLPSSTVALVNSWIDLNEFKALFLVSQADGSIVIDKDGDANEVLSVKIKQTKPQANANAAPNAAAELVYQGKIEAKKDSGVKIFDEAVVCHCGKIDGQVSGAPNYSNWKPIPCTPNSKE
jgi:hypothetical protein